MVSFALNIMAQGGTHWAAALHTQQSSLEKMNAASLVSATQLHRNREFSETMVSVAQWVGWMRKEQDTAWILPGIQQTTGHSTECLYCHKSYSTLFYPPKTHEISPDKKSFIHYWDFIGKPTRMSENHISSWRKTSVGKEDNFRYHQIAFPSYRSTLNKD